MLEIKVTAGARRKPLPFFMHFDHWMIEEGRLGHNGRRPRIYGAP